MTSPTPASVASRSTKALTWGLGGAAGKIAAQLVVQITLARMLDPVAFGQYAAVLTVIGFGYIFAEGGFGSALIQKKELYTADVSLALGWSLLAGALMAMLIYTLAPFLADQFDDLSLVNVFRACTILIPFIILSNLSSNLLRRDLHLKGLQIIHFIAYTLFFGGVAILMALNGWGVWSLVAGFAAQTLFSVVATYSISRHTLHPSLRGDPAIIRFGAKSLATDLAGWSMDNLDRFVVGRFWGLGALGLYSVAFNLSKAPSALVIGAAQSITFASASRLQNNLSSVRRGYLVVLTATALMTLPTLTLVAFESAAVLNLFYGAKWLKAAPYMAALAFSIPWICMGAITAAILRGIGSVGTQLRITIICAVILFSGFVACRDFSLAFAVWVVPATYIVRLLLLLSALHWRIELSLVDILLTFRGALILTVAGVSVMFLARALPYVTTIGMGTFPLLAGGAVIALLLCLRFSWFLGEPLAEIVLYRIAAGSFGSRIARLAKVKDI